MPAFVFQSSIVTCRTKSICDEWKFGKGRTDRETMKLKGMLQLKSSIFTGVSIRNKNIWYKFSIGTKPPCLSKISIHQYKISFWASIPDYLLVTNILRTKIFGLLIFGTKYNSTTNSQKKNTKKGLKTGSWPWFLSSSECIFIQW